MSVIATAVKHMLAAGMDVGSVVAAIEEMEAAAVPQRTARQERNRRYYENRKASERRLNGSEKSELDTPPDKEKVAPKEINPPKEKTPKGVQKKRAVRLPDDFVPDLDWAIAQGLSRQTAEMQAAKFRDYWKAAKDGAKLDWPATWRNWIRNSLDRMGIQPPPSAPKPERWRGFGTDKWAALMAHVRNTGEWSPAWGPPPSAAGCKVPADLLTDHDRQRQWREFRQEAA